MKSSSLGYGTSNLSRSTLKSPSNFNLDILSPNAEKINQLKNKMEFIQVD